MTVYKTRKKTLNNFENNNCVLLPSFLLNSMSANKPILMICQSSPKTRWGFPARKSSAPMFTTWHPMAEAEFSAKFKFSCKIANLHTCFLTFPFFRHLLLLSLKITLNSETKHCSSFSHKWSTENKFQTLVLKA